MTLYNIKSITTGKIVAFTTVNSNDSDHLGENEILETRLEAAVDDGLIPDDEYIFVENPIHGAKGVRI